MEHTKGPWEAHAGTSGWIEIIANHGDHIYENIANLSPRNACGVLELKPNHLANARLIVAAPDLLEAVKKSPCGCLFRPVAGKAERERIACQRCMAIAKAEEDK